LALSWKVARWPLVIALAVVVVDQLTKHWAIDALADGHTIDLFWTLRFNLTFNSGMAFSSGDWLAPFVPILAIGVVAVLLISTGRSSSRWYTCAVGLVMGGALGNVVDRVFRGDGGLHGRVVDFIDLQWWPIFNVADIAVVVGAVMLVVTTMRTSS
jgi:signal peptidase II